MRYSLLNLNEQAKTMLKTYTYIHMANLEITIEAEVTEGRPAKTYGEPEDCHPAEDGECEIVRAYINQINSGGAVWGSSDIELDGIKVFDGKNYTDLTTHICDEIMQGNLNEH